MKPWLGIAILCLPVALLVVACDSNQTTDKVATGDIDSSLLPDTEVTGATIYLYDRGHVTTRIQADRILKFESRDSTMGYTLVIDVLDTLARVTSNVVGDSGIIKEEAGFLHIFGHVVVVTDDGRKLETEHLQWDSNTDQIETDAFVKITKGEDDIMTGWGMIADKGLKRVRIMRASGSTRDSSLVR